MSLHQDTQRGKRLAGAPEWTETLDLLGGRLCLDFVNTVDARVGATLRDDLFSTYTDLVYWGHVVGILEEAQVTNLLHAAKLRPEEANNLFEQAFTWRETIYRVLAAVVGIGVPLERDIIALQSAYTQALTRAHLCPTGKVFAWSWSREAGTDLACMLWPVIASTLELLTSPEVQRVKVCPGAGDCGWLFLDTSKNGSRVWCSMESCGSRVKMRRRYARKRDDPGSPGEN